jgi:hypothetical protein
MGGLARLTHPIAASKRCELPMVFGVRSWVWVLVSCVLPGAVQAAQGDQAVRLPPVEVVTSREEDFVLRIDHIPGTRIWLRPVTRDTMLAAPRYHGRGLKAGDEIVSIDGQPLKEMQPGRALREFHRFSKYALPTLQRDFMDIEVRAPGSRTMRKVRLVRTAQADSPLVEKPSEQNESR